MTGAYPNTNSYYHNHHDPQNNLQNTVHRAPHGHRSHPHPIATHPGQLRQQARAAPVSNGPTRKPAKSYQAPPDISLPPSLRRRRPDDPQMPRLDFVSEDILMGDVEHCVHQGPVSNDDRTFRESERYSQTQVHPQVQYSSPHHSRDYGPNDRYGVYGGSQVEPSNLESSEIVTPKLKHIQSEERYRTYRDPSTPPEPTLYTNPRQFTPGDSAHGPETKTPKAQFGSVGDQQYQVLQDQPLKDTNTVLAVIHAPKPARAKQSYSYLLNYGHPGYEGYPLEEQQHPSLDGTPMLDTSVSTDSASRVNPGDVLDKMYEGQGNGFYSTEFSRRQEVPQGTVDPRLLSTTGYWG
ncbi:hypothetical protein K435DRAFT_495655 [Dendrothele bispora CBS 962.96]|uniref:Uncharacterized protein n=1 Tax=Dendrothele bispora (strain CBS 962.96) TaxID=1314807 RepID=A0A4S8KX36_DENBC|nr:hypothetical protein K435DRAFT_495655 [Dendrothele bispora CBS 962.96]